MKEIRKVITLESDMKVGDLENFTLYDYENKRKLDFNKEDNVIGTCTYDEVTENGTLGLMCPRCNRVNFRKIRYYGCMYLEGIDDDKKDIHTDSFVQHSIHITCENCKSYIEPIELDPNIAEAIGILNEKWYKTQFCCEGHGDEAGAYILFDPNSYRKVMEVIDTLPITWYLDLYSIRTRRDHCLVIRSEGFNYKEAMLDILDWAKSLKNARGQIIFEFNPNRKRKGD